MIKHFKMVEKYGIAEDFAPFVANTGEDLTLSFPVHGFVLFDKKTKIETQVNEKGENVVVVPPQFLKHSLSVCFQLDSGKICRLPIIPITHINLDTIPAYKSLKEKYNALQAKYEALKEKYRVIL